MLLVVWVKLTAVIISPKLVAVSGSQAQKTERDNQ